MDNNFRLIDRKVSAGKGTWIRAQVNDTVVNGIFDMIKQSSELLTLNVKTSLCLLCSMMERIDFNDIVCFIRHI